MGFTSSSAATITQPPSGQAKRYMPLYCHSTGCASSVAPFLAFTAPDQKVRATAAAFCGVTGPAEALAPTASIAASNMVDVSLAISLTYTCKDNYIGSHHCDHLVVVEVKRDGLGI